MSARWYVARTRTRREYVAKDHLTAAGFEVLLPSVPSDPPRPGRTDAPLFPSYLFLRFDLEQDGTLALGHVPGPVRLVTFEGVAPFLPDDAVESLVRATEEIASEGGIWPRFQPGEEVSVHWGGSEIWGRVLEENRSPRARVRVLLDFVGAQVDVQVPGDRVRLLTGSRPPRRTRGHGRFIGGVAAPRYAGAATA